MKKTTQPCFNRALLPKFISWLDSKGILHRAGKGVGQVLQIQRPNGWQCVFTNRTVPKHYTIANALVPLFNEFLNETGAHVETPVVPTKPAVEIDPNNLRAVKKMIFKGARHVATTCGKGPEQKEMAERIVESVNALARYSIDDIKSGNFIREEK